MHQLVFLVQHYGLLVVAIGVILDEGGLPVPSYPILFVAGAVAGSVNSIVLFWIVALVAAIGADLLWYWAGMRFGRPILALICKLALSPDSCVRKTGDAFRRFGPWTLLIGKFVPGLGNLTVALSGISRMAPTRFMVFDAAGAALFVGLPIMFGAVFKNAISTALNTLTSLGTYGLLLLIVFLALYIGARWFERKLFARRLRMSGISVSELAKLIESGRAPVIFDVRDADSRLREGTVPGAVAAHPSELAALIANYPRDAEVVIYCACPNEASAAVAALHLKRAGFANIRPLLGGIDAWTNAGGSLEPFVAQI